ncbi:glycosyl hydrolase [Seongchinamella unica]|uniref:beta-glucosidase n=2 Tax=Seongchinamella unica TaxID=2547392 RepID=A0A4R5LUU9_9GAMM|nr:glycosyl hydrolase [Seongchinamella unica]
MTRGFCLTKEANHMSSVDEQVRSLLQEMTLEEKIGQMSQVNGGGPDLHQAIRDGQIGSVLNEVNVDEVNELQRLAVQESRLGIPLLIGRDVIHGFKTIFPIPLGQAASWDPQVIERGAAIAAAEAASTGVNWTFAPMIDITRDPRWGRIAESLGEDPYLCGILGAAMVRGFQGAKLSDKYSIAACAKHFVGYGAVESGLDYNNANIPENELRNVYLPPFKQALDAGVATVMSSFSDLNGVPAAGNEFLMRQILRDEWGFKGFVVSDWDAIRELTIHGFSATDREAVLEATNAGINMEMASSLYREHIPALVAEGKIDVAELDALVYNILALKFELGLFANPYTNPKDFPDLVNDIFRQAAKEAAERSCVLLKNDQGILPLSADRLATVAVIGPLADDGYEQLGTWVFDGEAHLSHTCLQALHDLVGDRVDIRWARGMQSSRCRENDGHQEAIQAARESDVALMFMGEESILSGEAHCRADINLPGSQEALIEQVAATGTPVVLVVMAGRPLTIGSVLDKVSAVLYAWHPGTMGGPAIADLLFGRATPSGKLPVSFPRMVGQVPIYYARKNTGRPPSPDNITHIDAIDGRAEQTSLGMSAFHLDAGFTPLFPFGFGLTYTRFEYRDIERSHAAIGLGDTITLAATVHNTGDRRGEEIVQLYIRDLAGNVTRPVRELKGFKRVTLGPGESERVSFDIHTDELAFHNRKMELVTEPGGFHAWIGGDSTAQLWTEFEILD